MSLDSKIYLYIFISEYLYNLEIVKGRIKDKDIESGYSDVSKKTKLRINVLQFTKIMSMICVF